MFASLRSGLTPAWASLLVYGTLAVASVLPRDTADAASADSADGGDYSGLSSSAQCYDYIIVGGGLTGLVAANRLSENGRSKSSSWSS